MGRGLSRFDCGSSCLCSRVQNLTRKGANEITTTFYTKNNATYDEEGQVK
jgi:hypothetical protein